MAGVAGLLVLPVTVWAADGFNDVPNANVHHDAINAIADAGVTQGCTPTEYCPGDFVRRDQMGSFLDRLGALSGQDPVVNAATAESATVAQSAQTADEADHADEADNATNAVNATNAANADNADALEGLSASEVAPISVVSGSDPDTGAIEATFEDLPGGTTEITVPDGHQALILARFTAESRCSGPNGSWCRVRILVDGTEADPSNGSPHNFAFDSPGDTPGNDWEGHAMDRSFGPVGPGTYTVTVQRKLNGATSFWLDDWHLTVEARLTS